ncbi:MAG TPA: BMP family ABC transporter substrate-binding protein, partial [Clostridia bacterium]|nr:BMP family ABC transporter substrate-binding protein [Clostridia bacterium]
AVWDWGIYLTLAVQSLVDGVAIPVDFSGGLKEGVVNVSPLNDALVAPGTAEAIEAARAKILSGELHVFQGPLHGAGVDFDGNPMEINLAEGERFYEPQSSPSWVYFVDGVHENK